jgi:predicted  nucleic acid-binding Zn-ribbon protein
MTFQDSATLGKFNSDVAAISRSIDAGQEELRAAYSHIKRLEADLLECREYLEEEVDVIDGDYGEPAPNRAMQLVSMIDDTLHGPGNF